MGTCMKGTAYVINVLARVVTCIVFIFGVHELVYGVHVGHLPF